VRRSPIYCADVREVLRLAESRRSQPSAVILDSRTLQSSPESGERAGYGGHKKERGSKRHRAFSSSCFGRRKREPEIVVVLNWLTELRARMTAGGERSR
jgi:hypothetical protein